ncbi:hypothetical protein FZEAL_3293 [Fusarium zealandicum]|uniref:Apple domain-containing protein n=1 Tax=Fusarium zealandicum TaxID=1053134 RepID=A0A8H4XLY6_9HYPO|nr:hypothetical protein FZEAL_3293 [Fusarium zealandicum]
MRSIIALAALALSTSLDLAVAGPCKPKLSSTTDAATSTTTDAASPIITNELEGGNFARKGADGGIPGFTFDGAAEVVLGKGYTGDGSTDSGSVQLKAQSQDGPSRKRALGSSVSISQELSGLNPRTPYTVRFFYAILAFPRGLDLCVMRAYLGSQPFHEQWLLASGPTLVWGDVLEQVTPSAATTTFRVQMDCYNGGAAVILVDSIFMSNQVTPETIDDYTLSFGDDNEPSPTSTESLASEETGVSTTSTQSGTESVGTEATETETQTGTESTQTQDAETRTDSSTEQSSTQTSDFVTSTSTEAQQTEYTENEPSSTSIDSSSETTTASDEQSSTLEDPTSTSTASSETTETTSTSDELTSTSTFSSTSSESSTSLAPSETAVSEATVSRICANVGSNADEGKGCDRRPLTQTPGQYWEKIGNIEKEQCAARCLGDDNCGSFEYRYVNDCHKECRLYSDRLPADSPTGAPAGDTSIWAYDRSCAWKIPCPEYPEDSFCLNKLADTPAAGCTRRKATLKSCTEKWLRLSVPDCHPYDSCAGMCASYTDCTAFSLSSDPSETWNCLLYTESVSVISEPDPDSELEFVDLSCYACNGENMALTTYGLAMEEGTPKPESTCPRSV